KNTKQKMPKRLPRTAGAIDPIESACDLIEVKLSLLTATIEDALEIDLIAGAFRQFLRATEGKLNEFFFAIRARTELIIGPLPFAARFNQAGIEKQAKMSRNARLPHARDFLQLVYRKLIFLQQGDNAESGGIRQRA